MNRSSVTFLTLIVLVMAAPAYSDSILQYWQLTMSYDPTGLHIVEAGQIPPTLKEVRTPGLNGAPIRITYDIDWLNSSGVPVSNTTAELPVGYRTAPGESGEACQMIVPESGTMVLRLAGPIDRALPAAVRFTRRTASQSAQSAAMIPSGVNIGLQVVPIQRLAQASAHRDGPISSVKLRDTGPDNNRLVFVVMGDGYTAANLTAGQFTAAANNFVSAFGGRSPWDVLFEGTNVYRIDVASNEQGSDNDPQGTRKDTYFNSSFWVSGIQRLLAVDDAGYQRAVNAANSLVGYGLWDYLVIIVNSSTYGGSGGDIAVVSVHPSANEVALHETGHTFADLADEYSDAYPGYPAGDGEPNVDYDYSGAGLKWLVWVEPGTPLPTPNSPSYGGVVGAFQGARYLPTGIYRPWYNCLMRSLGVPFDPVCKEAHVNKYTTLVNLADSVIPVAGTNNLVLPGGTSFTAHPIPIGPMTYQWKLGDSVLPASDSTLLLTARDYDAAGLLPSAVLTLTVAYPTSLMRRFTASREFSWVLSPDCNGNGLPDHFDISSGTSLDLDHNGIPDECDASFCCSGTTGNVDGSEPVDLGDLTALVAYLTGHFDLPCVAEANVDGRGRVDLSDLTAMVSYLTGAGFVLSNCP